MSYLPEHIDRALYAELLPALPGKVWGLHPSSEPMSLVDLAELVDDVCPRDVGREAG